MPETKNNIEISWLPNGLTVATQSLPEAASVALGLWINVGTRHEPAGASGVAHLVEHMLFKGTTTKSAYDITATIEDVGGDINAYTSREQTAYYTRVLPEHASRAVELLTDILLNSVHDQSELEREREVIVQEIGERVDTPGEHLDDALQLAVYPQQNFGRPILGEAELISKMDRDEVATYVQRLYTAGAITLAAAGSITHAELRALAEQYASQLASGEAPTDTEPHFVAADVRIEREHLEQVNVALLWPAVGYQADDYYAYDILAQAVGGGMSSRLFQEVRETRGLAYTIYATTETYTDNGLLGIYASATPENCAELLTTTAKVLRDFAAGATEAEIARAKAQMRASLMMGNESTAAKVERLGHQLQVFGRVMPVDEMIASYEAVTLDHVKTLAAKLCASRPATGLIGPLSGIGAIPDITQLLAA